MVNKIIDMINWLRRQFNLKEIEKFDSQKDRAQATVKQASISDVQSFLNRAYTSSATGSGQTIPQEQLEKLGQINTGIAGLPKAIAAEMAKGVAGKNEETNSGPKPLPPNRDIQGNPMMPRWQSWRESFQ
jgi:hypothetical protein